MTTPRQFRILLTWSWVLLVLAVVVDMATEGLLPQPLRDYLETSQQQEWSGQHWLLLVVSLSVLAAVIAAYVGLYRFKRWGRSLWLWTGVLGCAVLPVYGPNVSSGWAGPFEFMATALYGFILALVYASPVAKLIHGEPDSGGNP